MNADAEIGMGRSLQLNRAVLIYTSGYTGGPAYEDAPCYATVHRIQAGDGEGAPRLGVGEPAGRTFLATLADSLGTAVPAEILPANALARTADTILWWTEEAVRPMFFRKGSELESVSGWHFPHPPLVWKIDSRGLYVRALAESGRPEADTNLFVAPYWNVNDAGLVCQGDMRRPEEVAAAGVHEWEDAFFESLFTHTNARELTADRGGIVGVWRTLARKNSAACKSFPVAALKESGEALQEFLGGGVHARS